MEPPVGSPAEWQSIICRFIADHVRRAGANGVVLGLSGGLDSAVVAALATQALGKEHVAGYALPSDDSHASDEADAKLLADHLDIAYEVRSIQPMLDGVSSDLTDAAVRGNTKARCRMVILYAEAQRQGRLVIGTGNKSELLVGYFTKHGDGGSDLLPIGDLYKSQVRDLARHLEIPEPLITKPPSAGLWEGQTDEAELGMSYDALDGILKGMERNQNVDEIRKHCGALVEDVAKVEKMVRRSEHKRNPPVVPKIGIRTVGVDWRRSVHWDA